MDPARPSTHPRNDSDNRDANLPVDHLAVDPHLTSTGTSSGKIRGSTIPQQASVNISSPAARGRSYKTHTSVRKKGGSSKSNKDSS